MSSSTCACVQYRYRSPCSGPAWSTAMLWKPRCQPDRPVLRVDHRSRAAPQRAVNASVLACPPAGPKSFFFQAYTSASLPESQTCESLLLDSTGTAMGKKKASERSRAGKPGSAASAAANYVATHTVPTSAPGASGQAARPAASSGAAPAGELTGHAQGKGGGGRARVRAGSPAARARPFPSPPFCAEPRLYLASSSCPCVPTCSSWPVRLAAWCRKDSRRAQGYQVPDRGP